MVMDNMEMQNFLTLVFVAASGTSEEHCAVGEKKSCCSWWNDECGSDALCNENQNHCENYCNGKYV